MKTVSTHCPQILPAFFLHIIVVFSITPFSAAETPAAESSTPATLPMQTDLSTSTLQEVAAGVTSVTLKNGLRVLMYHRGVAPVFSGVVGIRVGGVNEQVGHTGIAHMLEHMAFKGTSSIGTRDYSKEQELLVEVEEIARIAPTKEDRTPQQQQEWERLHTQLEDLWRTEEFTQQYAQRGGVSMNATTSKELTNYFVSLPRPAFEYWCWMESQRILDPVMRQFYKERDVVMEERRMRYEDKPIGKLYERLLGIAFLQHPYRYPLIGYSADIRHLTATEVAAFQRKFYRGPNIAIGLVGDIEPERDIEIIRKYFGRIPGGPPPEQRFLAEPVQDGERVFELHTKSSPEVVIVYRKPPYPQPDDVPISLLMEMLGRGATSPLHTALVKEKKLATSVSGFEGPGVAYPNVTGFFLTVRRPHTPEDVIEEFDQVLRQFKDEGVTKRRLQKVKRGVAMDYLSNLNANLSFARQLVSSTLLFDDWRAAVDWYDQAMAIEVDDITRVAKKYLQDEHRTIGIIRNAE